MIAFHVCSFAPVLLVSRFPDLFTLRFTTTKRGTAQNEGATAPEPFPERLSLFAGRRFSRNTRVCSVADRGENDPTHSLNRSDVGITCGVRSLVNTLELNTRETRLLLSETRPYLCYLLSRVKVIRLGVPLFNPRGYYHRYFSHIVQQVYFLGVTSVTPRGDDGVFIQ